MERFCLSLLYDRPGQSQKELEFAEMDDSGLSDKNGDRKNGVSRQRVLIG